MNQPYLFLIFLFFISGCSGGSERGEEPVRPNILFIFADDLNYRAVRRFNNPAISTPVLDRLAGNGVSFSQAYIQGAWNPAVCIASRAILNTGRGVHQIGDQNLEPYTLWGETFRQNGYETFMVGKWHNGEASLKRSFEYVGGLNGDYFRVDTTPLRNVNEYLLYGMIPSTDNVYDRPAAGNEWAADDRNLKGHWLPVREGLKHSSEVWTDAAVAFLENHDAEERPFFMYVAYHAPHDPRQAPREFLDMYPPGSVEVPPNFLPRHPFGLGYDMESLRDERLAPFPRTPGAIEVHLREYYAVISHMDRQIGRLLDALESSGKAGNTIVIFTSDNGLAMGEHGLMGKQSLYEHSLRIPLIFSGRGIPGGRINDSPVSISQIFATTCDFTDLPVPETVQYGSIADLVLHPGQRREAVIYAAYLDARAGEQYCRMVRKGNYKMIIYPMAGELQLFDLENDPWEMHDLKDDPSLQPVLNDLKGTMESALQRKGIF